MQNGRKTNMNTRQPRPQRHLSAASGGHRMRSVPNRTALTTREETMNGIWRSPKLKPKAEIQSGQKTTTSTPNIISDRCPRIEEE